MFTFITKKEIRSNVKSQNKSSRFSDFSELKNVLIIYEISDNQAANELKETLTLTDRQVNLLGYSADNKQSQTIFKKNVFTVKDTAFSGKPKANFLATFNQLSLNTNLIIDITRGKLLPINYLLSTKSDILIAGIEFSEFKLYDFVVELDKNVDSKFLCEQILFYLRKLKSKRSKIVPQL